MLFDPPSQDTVFKAHYEHDEAPPHPGEVLRDDVLPAIGLSRTALAKRLGVTTRKLSTLLSEQTPVTADLAMRLGTFFGQGARYWLGLQMQHDMWVTAQPVSFAIRPLDWKRPSKAAR